MRKIINPLPFTQPAWHFPFFIQRNFTTLLSYCWQPLWLDTRTIAASSSQQYVLNSCRGSILDLHLEFLRFCKQDMQKQKFYVLRTTSYTYTSSKKRKNNVPIVQIYYYCPISAQANKKIHIDMPSYTHILASFANIEAQNRKILNYGWINFPLAYVQVATMSVFLYFLVALFGRQYLIPCEGTVHMFFIKDCLDL